jgi:hypothetical protein
LNINDEVKINEKKDVVVMEVRKKEIDAFRSN